jgi:hypothetical protein
MTGFCALSTRILRQGVASFFWCDAITKGRK